MKKMRIIMGWIKKNRMITLGIVMTVGSCFLPWYQMGDLFSVISPGIQFQLLHPYYYDNGGLFILGLLALYMFSILNTYTRINNSQWFRYVITILIFVAGIIKSTCICLQWIHQRGIIGGISPEFGLLILIIGSGILLFAENNKGATRRTKS